MLHMVPQEDKRSYGRARGSALLLQNAVHSIHGLKNIQGDLKRLTPSGITSETFKRRPLTVQSVILIWYAFWPPIIFMRSYVIWALAILTCQIQHGRIQHDLKLYFMYFHYSTLSELQWLNKTRKFQQFQRTTQDDKGDWDLKFC